MFMICDSYIYLFWVVFPLYLSWCGVIMLCFFSSTLHFQSYFIVRTYPKCLYYVNWNKFYSWWSCNRRKNSREKTRNRNKITAMEASANICVEAMRKPMKPKWWIKNEQQCWTSKLQITQIDICRWFATVKHKLTLNWITTYFHFINLTLEIWLDLNRYRHCHYNFILLLSFSLSLSFSSYYLCMRNAHLCAECDRITILLRLTK